MTRSLPGFHFLNGATMGHYRGREAHKAKKKRKRDLERWVKPVYGRHPLADALEAWVAIEPLMRDAIRTFAAGCVQFVNAVQQFGQTVFNFTVHPNAEQGVEMSLGELREQAGSDGAAMYGVRFTAEGGFSIN